MSDIDTEPIIIALVIVDVLILIAIGALVYRLFQVYRLIEDVEVRMAKELAEFSDMISEDISQVERNINSGHKL